MVLDSSAVLAILQNEPEASAFAMRIERAERVPGDDFTLTDLPSADPATDA